MQLWIQGHDRNSKDAVRAGIEDRVASKLSRVSRQIRSVAISMRDVNGPRGGIDHAIQIIVRLKSGVEVIIRHQALDVLTGMPVAIERTVRAVKRELERHRSRRRQASRPSHVALELS